MTDTEFLNQIKENLRQCRKDAKVSQTQIARHLGISKQTYHNLENGYTVLTVPKLKDLAEYFGVPMTRILGESTDLTMRLDEIVNQMKSYAKK